MTYEMLPNSSPHVEESQSRRLPMLITLSVLALTGGTVVVANRAGAAAVPSASLIARDGWLAGPSGPNPVSDSDSDACIESSKGAVMDGYDVVAYFSLEAGSNGTVGSSDYTSTYNGYSFYFSTAANKVLFEASPTSYMPKYGGFCTYGIAEETWWTWDTIKSSGPDGDPNVWEIIDGELFFFMYEVPKYKYDQLCSEGVQELIGKGDEKWANYTSGDINGYFNTDCYWYDNKCGNSGDECIGDITTDSFSCEAR